MSAREPLGTGLGPYAHASLERARALALRLHAEELSPEHWLAALLEDEDCAATRAVLHAFADPETIGIEVLALCEGIMVVGSGRTLPFSVRAVEALQAARGAAAARAAALVEPEDVFAAALAVLPAELARRLSELTPASALAEAPPAPAAKAPVPAEGPLFRAFAGDTLRALGASARVAGQLGRPAIGPVHLLVGTLECSPALRERRGLGAARLRLAAAGQDEDPTPLPQRALAPSAMLGRLLAGLPGGAQTIDVLAWLLEHGPPELSALLGRQKVTSALVARCRTSFRDPAEGE